MTSNGQRRRPMSISAINYDVDDIETPPREEYRQAYSVGETTTSYSKKGRTRSCLIALILVIILVTLLSLAGVIIAIYSLVLTINRSATITTSLTTISTLTATATSTGLQCSSSPSTSYVYSTAAPSQCLNYTNNTDATRNIGYTQSINYCDDESPFTNATAQWIRFLDPAGILISKSPISPNRCGAVATGWYAGQDPIEFYTTATSVVCFYYTTNTCAACSLISMTNCKTFYVYLLPVPPSCNYRYCTL